MLTSMDQTRWHCGAAERGSLRFASSGFFSEIIEMRFMIDPSARRCELSQDWPL